MEEEEDGQSDESPKRKGEKVSVVKGTKGVMKSTDEDGGELSDEPANDDEDDSCRERGLLVGGIDGKWY